jgi:hypothetical protein
MTPPLRSGPLPDMHRLIPSRYSEADTVLADVVDDPADLEDIILLDGVTNDRIQGEQRGLTGISIHELVYGIPNAHIVNAAFTHTNEFGSRFNDRTRGAWYAADEVETSIAEVVYHKARRLAEIVVPELPGNRPDIDVSTYDDWMADFASDFHILKPRDKYANCLQPEPVPACYGPSQALATTLLNQASNGLIYESVRRRGHSCLVCFRPALVYDPRLDSRMEISFKAGRSGYEHKVRHVPIRRARPR